MATFDLFDSIHESERARRISAPASFFAPLLEAWQAFRRRFEERRIIVKLSRKDAHLLRDMGFEPDEIYDAVHNTWDEVPRRPFSPPLEQGRMRLWNATRSPSY